MSGNFNMDEPDAVAESVVPPMAPFRRPRSPITGNGKEYYNNKYQPKNHKEDSGSEKGDNHVKKFMPPGHNPPSQKSSSPNYRGGRGGGRGGRGGDGARTFANRAPQKDNANDDEEWPVKPAIRQDPKPKQPFTSPIKAQPSPLVQSSKVTAPANQATPPANQATSPANQATSPAKQSTPPSNKATSPAIKLPSVDNVAPARKLVPKNCIMDILPCDAIAILSVEAADEIKGSWVCVSIHEQYAAQYAALLGDLAAACEAAPTTVQVLNPALGETFCLFNSVDGGWYRARKLSPTTAAFLDAGKIVPMSESHKCSKLPAEFEATPEFCCTLISKTVKIGQNLKCTIVCKSVKNCKASIEDCETGVAMGECEVQRWRPTVEYCTPVTRENATGQCHSSEPVVREQVPIIPPSALPAAPVQPVIPEVPRPDVITNSRVVLVDMTAFDKAYVRPNDVAVQKKFDLVSEDVLMYGRTATPLTEPPQKGHVVVAKYGDDEQHYRALVKRTNIKQDKYQLEYIEYGNIDVTSLENLYACPPELDLQHRPTMTSRVTLQVSTEDPLTPAATNFVKTLKETEELILTLPSGARTAASGSAVVLTVAKDGRNLNKKLEEMCAPEWRLIEERGGDVIESEVMMLTDLEHIDLPAGGCHMDVLDVSTIHQGTIYVCPQDQQPHAAHVMGPLTQKMADYCNSEIGRQPYLPKDGELCVAQCPPYPQWFRALVLEQVDGAGGQLVKVWYIDYGNAEDIPVSLVRKMLPEFVRGLPALASTAKIIGFPEEPTRDQCVRALEHMELNAEGRGKLVVTRCLNVPENPGWYNVEAPALIAAINVV